MLYLFGKSYIFSQKFSKNEFYKSLYWKALSSWVKEHCINIMQLQCKLVKQNKENAIILCYLSDKISVPY